jgi:D-sedoheptulose 7-phosphate isomerase
VEREIIVRSHILKHMTASIAVKTSMISDSSIIEMIEKSALMCIEAYKAGHKVILAGNGGSASGAQHIAAEFVGRFKIERPAEPSLSLATDTSMLTAIGNDYSYDQTFARQLQANGKPGDVFIAITTLGNSTNLIKAVETGSKKEMKSIGFLGSAGGRIRDLLDLSVCIPSDKTDLLQEAHIMVGHIICDYVENSLFGHTS